MNKNFIVKFLFIKKNIQNISYKIVFERSIKVRAALLTYKPRVTEGVQYNLRTNIALPQNPVFTWVGD